MNQRLTALLPELIVALGAVAGLLSGAWLPRHRQWLVRAWGAVVCAAAFTVSAIALAGPAELVYSDTYAIDTSTGVARLVVCAATALTLLLAGDSIAGWRRETEFVFLLLMSAVGVIVLAGANDLLVLVAGFLLASIPLYALTGFGLDAPGTEAALKQYLLGTLAGVLMLVGVAVLFGAGGATGYVELAASLPDAARLTVVLGVVALLAGLLFELGAVPLHFWVPDVVQGATPVAGAFISTVPKVGAALAVYRLLAAPLGATTPDWALLVGIVAAASMTLGNFAAFTQTDVRRLLGYSTVSQVGYLLMAVAIATPAGLGLGALSLYLAAYAVTNLGAFAVVCAFPSLRSLDEWRGLLAQHRWLAFSLLVCLLGLVGTPPTAVFAGKLTVFSAAAGGGLGWLVVVAAVNTVASLFYYLRWIAPVFTAAGVDLGAPRPWAAGAAHLAAVVSIGLGIGSGLVVSVLGL